MPRPRFVSLKVLSSGQTNIKFPTLKRYWEEDSETQGCLGKARHRSFLEQLASPRPVGTFYKHTHLFPLLCGNPYNADKLLNSAVSFVCCVLEAYHTNGEAFRFKLILVHSGRLINERYFYTEYEVCFVSPSVWLCERSEPGFKTTLTGGVSVCGADEVKEQVWLKGFIISCTCAFQVQPHF